jgi:TldD protein
MILRLSMCMFFVSMIFGNLSAQKVPKNDLVLKAMKNEMLRTMNKLQLDDLKKPYFVLYYVADSSSHYISASFGDIKDKSFRVKRYGKVDIRIGSRKFDNSQYIGNNFSDYNPFSGNISIENDYDSIRKSLWILSDRAYKDSLQKFSQKDSYRKKRNIKEIYGDMTKEKSQIYIEKPKKIEAFDFENYCVKIKELSSLFRAYPDLISSNISFRWTNGIKRFINSEGSLYKKYYKGVIITTNLKIQNEDGYKVFASKDFMYENPSDIDFSKLREDIKKMAEDYSNSAHSESINFYVGPVIFEGEAASEFFNQLFVANISFAPMPWAEQDKYLKYYYEIPKLTDKIGMRIFPPFISAYDNPLEENYKGSALFGSYKMDGEGIVPKKLELVKRGKLRNIYLSRTPYKEFKKSNGHGRMSSDSFSTAGAGNVFINSEKAVSYIKLKNKLIQMGKDLELDYVVLIKTINKGKNNGKYLGNPVLAYKLNLKTKAESPLSIVEFEGLTMRALRDIVMTSDKNNVYNYYQSNPFAYSSGRYSTSIISPNAVLVGEIELKKTDNKPDKLPYLKHPFFSK